MSDLNDAISRKYIDVEIANTVLHSAKLELMFNNWVVAEGIVLVEAVGFDAYRAEQGTNDVGHYINPHGLEFLEESKTMGEEIKRIGAILWEQGYGMIKGLAVPEGIKYWDSEKAIQVLSNQVNFWTQFAAQGWYAVDCRFLYRPHSDSPLVAPEAEDQFTKDSIALTLKQGILICNNLTDEDIAYINAEMEKDEAEAKAQLAEQQPVAQADGDPNLPVESGDTASLGADGGHSL